MIEYTLLQRALEKNMILFFYEIFAHTIHLAFALLLLLLLFTKALLQLDFGDVIGMVVKSGVCMCSSPSIVSFD